MNLHSHSAERDAPAALVASCWNVRLLGDLSCERDGQRIERWPSRAAALLWATLVMAPHRLHPREVLIDRLWPGASPGVGRNRLRQTLFQLRALIEPAGTPPTLRADRHGVRLETAAVTSDVQRFERAVREADASAALAAYGGELLPGFYEDWVQDERQRLAAMHEPLRAPPPEPTPRSGVGGVSRVGAAGALRSGLPHFVSRAVGLDVSASRLQALVRSHRLVTVHGPGGIGKTRLAVETAASLLAERDVASPWGAYPGNERFDRVVFVALVDCVDAVQVLDALYAALSIDGAGNSRARLESLLGEGRWLLVLDNLEQVDAGAEQVIVGLLQACAGLHVLATSRRLLVVDGEHAFEHEGLPVPDPADAPAAVAEAASVALFLDRAHAARPGLRVPPGQMTAVGELVRALGGVPLAIELAASRVRTQSVSEMLAHLRREVASPMLDLLARPGGARHASDRHASMRDVIACSWQPLDDAQRALMRALAVFPAPTRIDALCAVAGQAPGAVREALDALEARSMLQTRVDASGATRIALLQPVREFVEELCVPGDLAPRRQRLWHWLIEHGRRCAEQGYLGMPMVQAEMPLLMGCLTSAAGDGGDPDVAARMMVVVRRHWEIDLRTGLAASALSALSRVEPLLTDETLRCEVCLLLAGSLMTAGELKRSAQYADRALALAPSPRLQAQAMMRQANVWIAQGQDTDTLARTLERAMALAMESADLESQALLLRIQGYLVVNVHDDQSRGEALAAQAQAIWEQLGHPRNATLALQDRASCWLVMGRLEDATAALMHCEAVARDSGHLRGISMSAWQLGRVQARRRLPQAARASFRRALDAAWTIRLMTGVAESLLLMPLALTACGRHASAARLYGFAMVHWAATFGPLYRPVVNEVKWTRHWLRRHLGPSRLEALRAEGAGLSLPQAVALALSALDDAGAVVD